MPGKGKKMIAIIDYDAGNIRSVEKALARLGQQAQVTREPSEILEADGVILPGWVHSEMPWKKFPDMALCR